MRSPVHAFHLFLLLALLGGCAMRVEVEGDAQAEFAGARTWAWDSRGLQVQSSEAPDSFRSRLARDVEAAMAGRGFVRVAESPDLLVSAVASLERRERRVRTANAGYRLDSHNASASYWIEGDQLERRIFYDVRIGISLRRPGAAFAWRGRAAHWVDAVHGASTERLVTALADELPVASASGSPQRDAEGWVSRQLAGEAPRP